MTPSVFQPVRVVLGACIAQFTVIGLLISFAVFFKVFETEFGWSRTLISSTSSAAFLMMGVFAIFAGRLNDRLGPSIVLAVSGVVYGAGYFLMAHVTQPWHLLLLFGLFVGVGMGAHDVATLSPVAKWFPGKRGLMTGVVKTGTAAGQIVVPLVAAYMIVQYGWKYALMALGIAAIVLLLISAIMVVNPPDATSTGSTDSPSRPADGMSFTQARGTKTLWMLCAIQFLFFPTLMSVPLHIVVHGMDMGMTAALAATLLSTMGAASVVGRLAVGQMVDKIGGKRGYVLCFIPLIAALSVFLVIDSAPWLFVAMAVYGFGHGGLFTVVSPSVAEYFGLKAHGAIFGLIMFFGTLGGASGPIAAGWIFDVTGSYFWAFGTLNLLAVIGLVLVLLLPKHTVLASAEPAPA